MNLKEIYVDVRLNKERNYHYGEFSLDCGIKISGIHFYSKCNHIYVNYPAVRDKSGKFHPSFHIKDISYDKVVKNILADAWQRAMDEDKKVIYGYRKEGCVKMIQELSAEDFEWTNEERKCEILSSDLQRKSLKIELLMGKRNTFPLRQAYANAFFNMQFAIKNIKIYTNVAGNFIVCYPKQKQAETITFLSEDDRNWVETSIIEQFRNQVSNEEYLFQVLWSASDNGYILQSKIRQIMEQNRIDWKNLYHVDRISELIEKVPFLSVRILEPTPEHYVKWVVISYEKDQQSVIVKNDTHDILTEDVKKELHDILSNLYIQNGKIDLCEIIPYLMEEYPQTFQKLPKVKLKTILQNCEFIEFEGGPILPVYVKVLDATPQVGQNTEESKAESIDASKIGLEAVSENLLAKNNPFTLRENTKLIIEHSIPNSTLPKVTTQQASRYFYNLVTLEQMDSMDLELVYWISNLKYAKTTFLYDLIIGKFIEIPAGKKFSRNKLDTRLMRLYKTNLINFYKLCSVDENGNITNKSSHRILMITAYGRTQLRAIGRKSNYDFFMALDNIEKILNQLSVNQWFTKFITVFKDTIYHLETVLTAKIAEARAARIPLVINMNGIPIFVKAFKRGNLYNQEICSGELAFWFRRVGNLLENYRELYINGQFVSFRKKPKLVLICEDIEHCEEVYLQLLNILLNTKNQTLIDNLWFAQDVDVYNDFLHSHFRFDIEGRRIPEAIDEFFETNIARNDEQDMEDVIEQNLEEDIQILTKLDHEERQMMLSIEELTKGTY